jgi:hypothetical protein
MADDPPPRDTRDLPPYGKEMVAELLANASNRSAPGALGHTWRLLKWAWNAASDTIFDLISGCVRAGHHPRIWRIAIVCTVPKPNRADYSLAKNFRPISLLECMGKLIEKLIARLLYREIVTSPVLSWCCAPTYASPLSPPSLCVPTGPLYRLYRTNFGRCRDLDA